MTAPAQPFSFGAPVPQLFWEELETKFKDHSRRLIRDIAKTLAVSHEPLERAFFKGQVLRPYLYEDQANQEADIGMRCTYLCQRPDAPALVQTCGQPVLWSAGLHGTHRCPTHAFTSGHATTPVASLRRVTGTLEEMGTGGEGPLYVTEMDEVVGPSGLRGQYHRATKKVVLIQPEDGGV